MFTWSELLGMGIRQKAYWLRQVNALERQRIMLLAHAVGIGMAGDPDERQKAIDDLELTATAAENKAKRSELAWDMAVMLGGGTGV